MERGKEQERKDGSGPGPPRARKRPAGRLSLDTRVPELDPTAGEWGPGTSYSSAFSTAGKGGMLTRW